MSTTADPSDLRRSILRELYLRRAASLTAHRLAMLISRKDGEDVTEEQVKTELVFLMGNEWVRSTPDPVGSTAYHYLSPEGVLFCERNKLTD